MNRLIHIIILGMFAVYAHSQDFINNPDYIYSQGVGKTQEEAERAALISLSNTLKVEVSNFTSYKVESTNNKIDEHFSQNIKTSSNMTFNDEVKTMVKNEGKNKYVVYKYINKKEYVDSHLLSYKEYINKADSLRLRSGKMNKHQKNIILGYYYMAYSAINTPLMDSFGNYNALKNDVIRKDSIFYVKDDYGLLSLSEKLSNGFRVVLTGGSKFIPMMGIEYLYQGKWRLPERIYKERYDETSFSSDVNGNETYMACFVFGDNTNIKVRFLYEFYDNGRYYKIDVPERWYFYDATINNFKFL